MAQRSLARAMPRARLTRQVRRRTEPQISPLKVHELVHGNGEPMPDPIEWIVSDKYLDRPNLYPRQGTIIKVMFLRDDMFTQYDYDVIGQWEETFLREGNEGVSPKILDRIRICKEQGRSWFRETLGVIGRRGSKGYMGALSGSYVLWHYMFRPGGPQAYYGIDRDKRLTAIVFAGKKEQALANQWRDLTNVITGAPCFAPYISRPQAERLTVFAPSDMLKAERQRLLGVEMESDQASFEIVAKESTLQAGRGPASFMQFYDEMAHVVATGANRSAEDVYAAATPALDQFGVDAFLYEPSSPWQMQGQFYENWQKAIELEPDGTPAYPEMLMLQLPSWGTYEDWEEADRIPLRPPSKTVIEVAVEVPTQRKGKQVMRVEHRQVERVTPGPTFRPLKRAIQAYDDQMRQLERANPETFAVERRSHWAESQDAYLDRKKIEEMFKPWRGEAVQMNRVGILAMTYKAHGDPAKSGDSFGFAIAHPVWDPDLRLNHVVFDNLHRWQPSDWDDGKINYLDVEDDLEGYIEAFKPDELTFDQFNSVSTIARLQRHVHERGYPKQINIFEQTATRPRNWKRAEVFKTALNLGLVHAPTLDVKGEFSDAAEWAELELRFLQEKNGVVDHPTSGPVQSKDIADCIMECVYSLIGEQVGLYIGKSLAEVGVRGGLPGGADPYRNQTPPSADPAQALAAATSATGRARGMGGMGAARGGMRRRGR